VAIHADRVEVAGALAVAIAQAAPEAGLAAAGHLRRGDAALRAAIVRAARRHVVATGTGQTRHETLPGTGIHAEVGGDRGAALGGVNRAGRRRRRAAHDRLGECMAAGEAAGTAVGARQ
jgi:hypothetical protein